MPTGDTHSFDLPAAALTSEVVEQTLDHIPAGEWHVFLNCRIQWTDPASAETACSTNVGIDLDASDDGSWESGINLRFQQNYPSHTSMVRTQDLIEQSVVTIPTGGRDLVLHKSGEGPLTTGTQVAVVTGRLILQKVSLL